MKNGFKKLTDDIIGELVVYFQYERSPSYKVLDEWERGMLYIEIESVGLIIAGEETDITHLLSEKQIKRIRMEIDDDELE